MYTLSHANSRNNKMNITQFLSLTPSQSNFSYDASTDTLTVSGLVAASKLPITNYPKTVIADYADFRSYVGGLPKKIKARIVDFSNSPITELKASIEAEHLYLNGCKYLTSLPSKLDVKVLTINETNLDKLPKSLHVDELNMLNCNNIKKIGAGVVANTINASNCRNLSDVTKSECVNLNVKGCRKITELRPAHKYSFLNIKGTGVNFIDHSISFDSLILDIGRITNISTLAGCGNSFRTIGAWIHTSDTGSLSTKVFCGCFTGSFQAFSDLVHEKYNDEAANTYLNQMISVMSEAHNNFVISRKSELVNLINDDAIAA